MANQQIIDIHVHSTLKPYGQSFKPGSFPLRNGDKACLWTRDRDSEVDDAIENIVGISRYRQSDFSSLSDALVSIACVSLYPTEIGFLETRKIDSVNFKRFVAKFASMFGRERIDHLLGLTPDPYYYFPDLEREYHFLENIHQKPMSGIGITANLMRSAADIIPGSLNIIVSIEGAHVFCDGRHVNEPANWLNVAANIKTVKQWTFPPFFISLGHHFYNAICTHGKSLEGPAGKLLDQSDGMREQNFSPKDTYPPISVLGYRVIDLLLDKTNGRRILIDVKHMSMEARIEYYKILETKYANDPIPVICSHGACDTFHAIQVNMSPADVKKIYDTGGLFGIELDQRILGFKKPPGLKWVKYKMNSAYRREYDAYFVWRQIEEIAAQAYGLGYTENPWSCICIGSDYDGIINPLNSFRTAASLPDLHAALIPYANAYLNGGSMVVQAAKAKGWNAHDLLHMLMYKNAFDFISKHFVL